MFENVYFINGTTYAGKSTMVHLLAEKYGGIECGENYHDQLLPGLSKDEFPNLTYTRDLEDWHDFIRRTPEEYENWFDNVARECETLELEILTDLCKQGKGLSVDSIAKKHGLNPELVEQIVRLYVTHPGVTVDGIMTKMGLLGKL